jgi:hypothetical protein
MKDTQSLHEDTLTEVAQLIRRDIRPVLTATAADGSFRAHDALATSCTAAHIDGGQMTAAFFAIDEHLVRHAARAHGLPEPSEAEMGGALTALWSQRVRFCSAMIAQQLAAVRR